MIFVARFVAFTPMDNQWSLILAVLKSATICLDTFSLGMSIIMVSLLKRNLTIVYTYIDLIISLLIALCKQTIRGKDIVPHVPTLSMGFYAHIGREFRYRPWSRHKWKEIGWGKVTQIPFALPVIPGVLWDAVGSSIILPFSLIKSPWSLTDHSPTKYINSLSKTMGQQKDSGILTLGNYVMDDAEEEIVVQKSPQVNSNYEIAF